MLKKQMENLMAGQVVLDTRNNVELEIVGVGETKVILINGKEYSKSTLKRYFKLVEQEIPEVVEPDNTVINDIEQAEDLTQEQDTQVVEPTITSDNTVHESSYTYAKNLDFKYLGEIILINHKFSMLENVYTNEIIFCTVEAHAITISGFGYGGVTLPNGSQIFNLVRSGDELDNEVRILIVKEDYINRFQGKKLKVKIRKAFQELDEAHSADYIQKNCPLIIQPKSFWTDVVLPLKEGKDILPELDFYSSSKGNEQGAFAHIGLAGNELHVLEVNPKILPGDLVNKLRIWGFKDSYMEEGYIININMKQIGDDFIPIFNEVANIVGLNPITDQQQNTQQQEQQEDTTANTDTDTAVNEIHEDTEQTGQQDVVEANTGTIRQNNLITDINNLMDLHDVQMEAKKEYIKVSMPGKRGALCMIRQTRYGTGIHIDMKSKVMAALDENYRGMLIEQYNCSIYDQTRGYYRVFDCSDLDVLETIILTAKQVG